MPAEKYAEDHGEIAAAVAVLELELQGEGVGVREVAASHEVDGKDSEAGKAEVTVSNLLKNRLNS